MVGELDRQFGALEQGDHVCLLYDTPSEQRAAVVPFMKEGLARGERCVYLADEQSIDEVAAALAAGGIGVAAERARGALVLRTGREAYLHAGRFDPATMFDRLRRTADEAVAAGFSGLWATSEMTWALGIEEGLDRLIEYEAPINRFLRPSGSPAVVMCQYNRRRFPPAILRNVLRTHPVAVLGDQICPNLYYEPPEIVLGREPEDRSVEWMVSQLRRSRAAERELEEANFKLEARVAERTAALQAELEANLSFARELRIREEQRAQAEESLRKLSRAVEQSPATVVITDTRGSIEYVNPKFTQTTGYTAEEAIGQNPRVLKSGETPSEEYRRLWQTISSGGEWRGEFHNRKKSGELYWEAASISPITNAEGEITHFVAVKEEITQRKLAEEALLQSNEALRLLESTQRFLAEASRVLASSLDYESTLAAVARLSVPRFADWCAVDAVEPDGSIRRLAVAHADPAKVTLAQEFERHYPLNPDSPHGAPNVLRTGRSEIHPEVSDAMLAAMAAGPEELAMLKSTGVCSSMIVPLRAGDRTLGAITLASAEPGRRYGPDDLALAEELAYRAALALDNARLYREAREAVRMLDDFLSVAAHELKTPVTSLRGFAQVTLRQLDKEGALEPERLRRALQIIDQQSQKLSDLVSRLLERTRIESGRLALDKTVVDVRELAEGVMNAARMTGAHHSLELLAGRPVRAMADPLRLEQVLTNLLDNALKYSPEGGAIEVEVGRADPDTVRLSVRDHGAGIPPEHRPRVFDRFYQAHASDYVSGMGLGLYISRHIVDLHGGKIEIESPPDGGTRFVVSFPAGLGDDFTQSWNAGA